MSQTNPNEPAGAIERRAYMINEMCTAYGVSRTRIYAEIKAGRLVARRIGGRTMIARSDADAWLSALPTHQPSISGRGRIG